MESRQMLGVYFVAILLAAAPAFGADAPSPTPTPQKRSNPLNPDAIKASLGGKSAMGGKAASSQCGKDCFDKAKQLGFDKLVADSLACFAPYKGVRLSSADCCDKAELLFGRGGALAHCFCCPEFAREMLEALPVAKLDFTHDEYLEKLHMCRVPIVKQPSCSPRVAKERAAVKPWYPTLMKGNPDPWPTSPAPMGGPSNRVPLQPGSNGPAFSPISYDRPVFGQFNLTGIYPMLGFQERYSSSILADEGRKAINDGQIEQIVVSGASDFYNDYMTGFMMFLEKTTPRYNTPILTGKLPPLPAEYKEDVMWVANLRRGPYPDLISNRPAKYSPHATDTLQNGEVARDSPGVVFAGRVPSLNHP